MSELLLLDTGTAVERDAVQRWIDAECKDRRRR